MKTSFLQITLLASALALSSGCATSRGQSVAWEYKVANNPPIGEREALFNKLGQDGWVLVGVDSGDRFYFKRAKKQ